MKKIRAAVIGLGFIGRQHVEAVRRIPGAEVVAVIGRNRERIAALWEELDVPYSFTSLEEMLGQIEVDVIHNCTPTVSHYEINKKALENGIHVYSEKPLTLDSASAYKLTELAREKGLATGTNFIFRNSAMVQEMQERVANGSIGRVLTVQGEYLQDWMLYDTDYDWRLEPAVGGPSRAVADIGSHCMDAVQYICGSRIRRLCCRMIVAHPVRKKVEKNSTFSVEKGKVLGEIEVTNEDAAFIMAEMENGTQAILHISQILAGKKNALRVIIGGSKAALTWDQEQPDRLHIGNRDTGNEEIYVGEQYMTGHARAYASLPNGHPVAWSEAMKNGVEHFYRTIREGTQAEEDKEYATFADAAYIMKLIEACLESDRTGEWVTVEP